MSIKSFKKNGAELAEAKVCTLFRYYSCTTERSCIHVLNTEHKRHIERNYYYRPHTKYREGYVFSVSVLLFTGGGGGGWVSGKVHSEHIVATKVLMLVGGGGVGCPGKCTLSTYMGKSTILKISWDPPPPHLRERALCDICGEEHYFENRFRAGGKQSKFELPSCRL